MKSKNAAPSKAKPKGKALQKGEDLGGRYGKIGIPAVAAALPYGSDAKNPACAPVVYRDEERQAEMAEMMT
jgi:hypothetical protein